MAWQSKLRQTLEYFDKYDYPLTSSELKYWSGVKQTEVNPIRDYYFLPGRSKIVALRKRREKISQYKWQIARQVGERIKMFPTIAAVFVTGSLAMSNSSTSDDIDLMIVTFPNTLWISRPFVDLYLYFKSLRRSPGQTKAPNKICPNLWLDTNNLRIKERSLYHAHEILQAKNLWDRTGVQLQFLKQNFWVKNYLSTAYSIQDSKFKNQRNKTKFKNNFILLVFNLLFYIPQYVYMLPKMTKEKVGLGYAFFHPQVRS